MKIKLLNNNNHVSADVDKQTEGQSEEQTKLTVVNDIVDREQSEEKKPEELEKSKDNSEQPQEGETTVTSNDDDKTAADEQTEAAEESTGMMCDVLH